MSQTDFERFKENKKAELAECLRGSGRLDEDMPDMPGVSDADSLREQFYDSIGQPINAWFAPPDEIDWKGFEKELIAYSRAVWDEWMEGKRAQDKAEAIRAGRM
jgi:hypothetical protein